MAIKGVQLEEYPLPFPQKGIGVNPTQNTQNPGHTI
jgi:hypothetical protein